MPEAMNLIRTSPCLGSSSSSSVSSHGLPGSLMIAALVRMPLVLPPCPAQDNRLAPPWLGLPPVGCQQFAAGDSRLATGMRGRSYAKAHGGQDPRDAHRPG